MQRTLERELKVPETVIKEAINRSPRPLLLKFRRGLVGILGVARVTLGFFSAFYGVEINGGLLVRIGFVVKGGYKETLVWCGFIPFGYNGLDLWL